MCPTGEEGISWEMPSTMPNPARKMGTSVSFFPATWLPDVFSSGVSISTGSSARSFVTSYAMSIAISLTSCLKSRVLVRLSRRMVSLCWINGCDSTVRLGNCGDGTRAMAGEATRSVASARPAGIFSVPFGAASRPSHLEDHHAWHLAETRGARALRDAPLCAVRRQPHRQVRPGLWWHGPRAGAAVATPQRQIHRERRIRGGGRAGEQASQQRAARVFDPGNDRHQRLRREERLEDRAVAGQARSRGAGRRRDARHSRRRRLRWAARELPDQRQSRGVSRHGADRRQRRLQTQSHASQRGRQLLLLGYRVLRPHQNRHAAHDPRRAAGIRDLARRLQAGQRRVSAVLVRVGAEGQQQRGPWENHLRQDRGQRPARRPAVRPAGSSSMNALLLLLIAQQPAVTVDSEAISGLGARNIGSAAMSGRIAALAAVEEGARLTIYVGAASGGVWKSVNGGTTFKPVFDKQPVQSIGAVTIDPKNPKVVWVGTGESWMRNSVSIGDGIYRSDDGGENWTNMGLRESEHIVKILVDPTATNTVYVCVPGKLWSDSEDRGVYKTTDGGKTWTKVLRGTNLSTGCSMLAMDPSNAKTLYAGMWDFRRRGWTFRSGGDSATAPSASSLFKSTDGGATWTDLTAMAGSGLPPKP